MIYATIFFEFGYFFHMCSLLLCIHTLPLATPGRGYVGEVEGRGHENDDGWGMV